MNREATCSAALVLITLLGYAPTAVGGDHGHKHKSPIGSTCYVWQSEEVEETVYTVEYKEVKKMVKRPVIKEIRRKVSCKVCKPFPRDEMAMHTDPDYKRDVKSVDVDVYHTEQDECGNCTTTKQVQKKLVTCIKKCDVTRKHPVLKWQSVPVEDVHYVTYLVREMVEEEVTLQVPHLVPRKIKRTVWRKIPFCAPACDPCCP